MKNRSEFGKLFEKHNKLGVGAEIGVQRGHNSLQIIKSGWTGKIMAVDLWDNHDEYTEALINLGGLKVDMIKGESLSIAKLIPDESLDWIYIDADHTFNGIYNDLHAWYSKVRKGGIVSGHDYLDGNYNGYLNAPYGVKTVVDDFVRENNKELNVTTDDTYDNLHFDSWWFIK
jgi:predicted O-methyltransferase YrrM